MESVSIKTIISVIAGFWFVTLILPKNLVIPISAGVGLAALVAGILRIYKLTDEIRNLPVSERATINLFSMVMVSAGVACVSLALWVPLFTFRYLFFWKVVNFGNIILWSITTGVYSYLLFLEAKISFISENFVNGSFRQQIEESSHPVIDCESVGHLPSETSETKE
ncbi:MAG: hypothetical protein GY795_09770 [Desulfobacterales bacterium]|nr:hypothetical protein [Desulfobacterales bacterium]